MGKTFSRRTTERYRAPRSCRATSARAGAENALLASRANTVGFGGTRPTARCSGGERPYRWDGAPLLLRG